MLQKRCLHDFVRGYNYKCGGYRGSYKDGYVKGRGNNQQLAGGEQRQLKILKFLMLFHMALLEEALQTSPGKVTSKLTCFIISYEILI